MVIFMKKRVISTLAGVLAAATLSSCASTVPSALVKAVSPPKINQNDADERNRFRSENVVDDSFYEALNEFTAKTAEKLLQDSGNLNYSPLSLFFALSMAAEGAEGETAAELQRLLYGSEGARTDDLNHLLNLLLGNPSECTELAIADSIWSSTDIKMPYAERMAEKLYSEVFVIDAFNEKTAKSMSDWVSEKTKGTLKPEFSFDEASSFPTVMSLINTIYFKSEWVDRFQKSKNTKAVFHAPTGDVEADFMNRGSMGSFSRGDGWLRASLSLKGGSVTFVLPTGDKDIRELLADSGLRVLLEGGESTYGDIIWSVPKFSFSSDLNFKSALKDLGCKSLFTENADFSNMSDTSPLLVSDVLGGTQISLDEKGVCASAYTAITYAGAAMPQDKAEMILNRPFLYQISYKNVTLFTGIVENPGV